MTSESVLKFFESNKIKFEYTHVTKPKNKTLKIIIKRDAKCIVISGNKVSKEKIEKIIDLKKEWIIEKILEYKNNPRILLGNTTKGELDRNKKVVLKTITNRLKHYNKIYNYSWSKVSIRDQSTRWGSCSSNKNLNFNYKIIHLPEHLIDYIVVHEMCHLKEMNHSKSFWSLVEIALPQYKILRKELSKL